VSLLGQSAKKRQLCMRFATPLMLSFGKVAGRIRSTVR
jgi:hypothetical protein